MTSEEIVKALRTCVMDPDDGGDCENCPASRSEGEYCLTVVMSEAASLIEQLTAENVILPDGQASAIESLRKEIEWKDMVIALAQRKQAQAEAERDAAIVDLRIFAGCDACRHYCNHRRDHQESLLLTCCDCAKKQSCKCSSCRLGRTNWEWFGLQREPEKGGKT